jgi:N utilization substance protein A
MLGEIQNHEIPKNVRNIATERRIDPARIFKVLEDALLKSLVCVYGKARLAVEINHDSGVISIMECRKIVPDEEYDENHDFFYEPNNDETKEESSINDISANNSNYIISDEEEKPYHYRTISFSEAKKINQEVKIGSMINLDIPNAWNNFKKTKNLIKIFNKDFMQHLTVLIREQEYNHFITKQGTMINAVVKRLTRDGYILIYDNYEILLPSKSDLQNTHNEKDKKINYLNSETILNERFGIEDSINVYIKSVVNNTFVRYQVLASRTHPMLLAELLKQNVPEIRDEEIIINKIVRIPGLRAKVVVHSIDKNLDPVGACIGIRGARIKAISQELKGEKIDVIEYSSNIDDLVKNAIYPVKPLRISIDDDEKKIFITVADKDLSNAIGKQGVNTKLLSSLINSRIIMISESVDATQKLNDFKKSVEEFKNSLDVDEIIAQLLVVAGFKSIHSVIKCEKSQLMKIEHFNEELIDELRNRAKEFLDEERNKKIEGIEQNYLDCVNKYDDTMTLLIKLIDNNIKSLQDLADLDIYELMEIINDDILNESTLSEMIIDARKKINEIE